LESAKVLKIFNLTIRQTSLFSSQRIITIKKLILKKIVML
jgi:hypothetical protein